MKSYSLENIKRFLEEDAVIIASTDKLTFNNVKTLEEADKNSLVWIKPSKKDKKEITKNCKAAFIICDHELNVSENDFPDKVIIKVKNPKLNFIRILEELFTEKIPPGISKSAEIHPEAVIGKNVFIGAFTYIGNSEIGDNSVVHGHSYIYDNVKIGNNVTINAGCIIGIDGYGYERNENGELEKFPHVGGVVIEDNVEIGANTCIDRGALGNTLICSGAKIDNLVHVAHNVQIGKNAAVIAMSMLGGSVKIGEEGWIAPAASVMNQLSVGNKSVVGMGAVVTKNIPDGETWTGLPARPMKEFLEIQKKLRSDIDKK